MPVQPNIVGCRTSGQKGRRDLVSRRTTWNGSITATASGSSSLVAVLETGEPVHSNHLDAVAPGRVSLAEPGLEHLLRSALDHIQQPRRTGTVPDRRQVDDHGDVPIASAGVAPAVLVDADHVHTVEPAWVLDTRLPSASTASFAVFHDTPRPSATRATVKC